MGGFRLGVDIGGTFTDVVLADERTGEFSLLKVPSTPDDPAQAVEHGVASILAKVEAQPSDVTMLVHGTTLALNTVLERSGASVGLIVTRGFGDLLELRRLRLAETQNFFADRPRPLIPRRFVREVRERTMADGSIHITLDEGEVATAVGSLQSAGCSAIAICFLHAYTNPVHERIACRITREVAPALFVSPSHEIWPQRREYERCIAAVINAYVGERMQRYFDHLRKGLRAIGIAAPVLSTKSNGGMMTARSAGERPVETLFSGPAAGVVGAWHFAGLTDERRLITLDMGGTSTDAAILDESPVLTTDAMLGDLPVVLPTIDISSIGAGGGSIAWTDAMGVLKVGPGSAGAIPGPACYGRGGREATITDAYVTLGILDPERFLGGTMPLHSELAVSALTKLGTALHQNAQEVAWSVVEVATANMLTQFTPLLARYGVDPRDCALLAYGGAGPTHVFLLASEVGIDRVIIPPNPGGMCALGCLVADLRADFVRSWLHILDDTDVEGLESTFRSLEEEARAWLVREGLPVNRIRFERVAHMRYKGQSFEISVPLAEVLSRLEVVEQFHERYRAIYGYADPNARVEVVDVRVQVVGEIPRPRLDLRSRSVNASPIATRPVFVNGTRVLAPVYKRTDLPAGWHVDGPAVLEQYDTTTFLPPRWTAYVDAFGNLIGKAN